MPGFPWWVWIVAAGVVGLAELHLPGAYLIWIGLGAAITGLLAAFADLDLAGQIGAFAVASALSCGAGFFVYRRLEGERRSVTALNDRTRLMLGARGTVCEALVHGQGKVRIGDGVWLAAGRDLPVGTAVVVTAVSGTRLHVDALAPEGRAVGPSAAAASADA